MNGIGPLFKLPALPDQLNTGLRIVIKPNNNNIIQVMSGKMTSDAQNSRLFMTADVKNSLVFVTAYDKITG